MFALYINESQAVPFYGGHNPIFTWIWGLIHMKNALFLEIFLILYLLFLPVNSKKCFPLCCSLFYLVPKKGKWFYL